MPVRTPIKCLQRTAIHILPNILQSKGNQIMKFGQLVEDNKRNNSLKNYAENEVKARGQQLSFNIFR